MCSQQFKYKDTVTAPLLLTGSLRGSEVQHYNKKEALLVFSIQNVNASLKIL